MTAGTAVDGARAVLLDTCALIWLANGDALQPQALSAIISAGSADGIFVSPASAWEIGMLSRPRQGRSGAVSFLPDPQSWFARFVAGPGIRIAPLLPEIMIAASLLPEPIHGDPGDRLILATARHHQMPVVTRDRKIIDYASAGHARVIAC
jgi:PIN domain nuclease of toxin-antitoxin system